MAAAAAGDCDDGSTARSLRLFPTLHVCVLRFRVCGFNVLMVAFSKSFRVWGRVSGLRVGGGLAAKTAATYCTGWAGLGAEDGEVMVRERCLCLDGVDGVGFCRSYRWTCQSELGARAGLEEDVGRYVGCDS